MLFWLILGCLSSDDGAVSTTESQESSGASLTPSTNGTVDAQDQQGKQYKQGKQGQQGQQGQSGQNGYNGQHGPLGNVAQGRHQGGQPHGVHGSQGPQGLQGGPSMGGQVGGQMQQPEPFHATVTFDWTAEPTEPKKLSEPKKPISIIWISLDTVHAKRMSIYGGPAQVPNLERFAKRAITFDQAISHFPETALSHWTMMSSVLPEVHGNVPANGGSIYSGPTMADIAKAHGYATGGFIGGVTMTDQASGFGRSFDTYDDQFTFSFKDMSRDGAEVTDRARTWIEQQGDGPYFAFAHYFDAHFPYTPKKNIYDADYSGTIDGTDAVLRPYRDGQKVPSQRDVEHVLALYDAEITELDAKIAPLLQLVDEQTVIVVTADHGESFSHDYYFNHRAGLWDEVTHVPLLIGGALSPELSGKRVSQQVGLIDVLPTVLEVADLPGDKRFMGTSKLNLVGDSTSHSTDIVYSITDPWMPEPQFAARTTQYKWIDGLNKNWVYDLQVDSLEQTSLSEIPTVLRDSNKAYQQWIAQYAQWQVESTRTRQISDEECKRLMALGYTTCMK